jgi:S1 RNA binding domain protein
MALAVGQIVEGKVTGITKFGAFVELPEGKTGMVHISEIASTFVKEIRDFVQENQMVRVKILSIAEDGKISLSIKKAQPEEGQAASAPKAPQPRRPKENNSYSWTPKKVVEPQTFEEMLSKFKQTSEDKMSDLKHNMETKRGSSGKRGGSYSH